MGPAKLRSALPLSARLPLVLLALLSPARAHNPDTSYARVRLLPDHLELRLTFDVFTLQSIVPGLDANRDRTLSRAELRAALPAARAYLAAHIFLQLDDRPIPLGVPGEPFWPLDATDPLPAEKWHETSALISFPFDTPLPSPPASVGLGFAVFDQLGDQHTILGNFEAAGQLHPIVFNLADPDYRLVLPPPPTPVPAPAPAMPQATPSPTATPTPGTLGKWQRAASLAFILLLGALSLLLHRRQKKSTRSAPPP